MKIEEIAAWGSPEKLQFLEGVSAREECWTYEDELVALAADPDPVVRLRAVPFFWELANPMHIDLLLNLAQQDPSSDVRTAALSALGRYIYDGYVMEELDEEDLDAVQELLVDVYKNEALPVEQRSAALESLGFITEEDIEALIQGAYQQPLKALKVSALFAMGRSGTRTWDKILMKELRSPDPELRFEAVRAAGETDFQVAAPPLELIARGDDRNIQLAAIEALGKIGAERSRGLLLELRNSPDEDVRDAAHEALEDMDQFAALDNATMDESAASDRALDGEE